MYMSKTNILDLAKQTKTLAEKATPGPWEPCIGSGNCEMTALSHQEQEGPGTEFVCDLLPEWAIQQSPRKSENMDFIAHSRTAAPQLADAVIETVEMLKCKCTCHESDYQDCAVCQLLTKLGLGG